MFPDRPCLSIPEGRPRHPQTLGKTKTKRNKNQKYSGFGEVPALPPPVCPSLKGDVDTQTSYH
eukprot:15445020-Alexandrium_andersonii.AAC.1